MAGAIPQADAPRTLTQLGRSLVVNMSRMSPRPVIRDLLESDLPAISAIAAAAPSASDWEPADYLAYAGRVALVDGCVAGFLVSRTVAPETEILNLAVAPEYRRRGVGQALVLDLLSRYPGDFYLEVRESNDSARRFYEQLGFVTAGKRPWYYHSPQESAVVMKLHSC